MWCSAADTHLKLQDSVVSVASFLTGGVFECDLAHRGSVAVLCMLYKTRCNPFHPLYGALSVPYVPVRVTRGAVIAHRYTYATRSVAGLLFPCLYLSGTILVTPYSMVFDWLVSRAELPFPRSLFVSSCFPFLFFHSIRWYCGAGVFGLKGC